MALTLIHTKNSRRPGTRTSGKALVAPRAHSALMPNAHNSFSSSMMQPWFPQGPVKAAKTAGAAQPLHQTESF